MDGRRNFFKEVESEPEAEPKDAVISAAFSAARRKRRSWRSTSCAPHRLPVCKHGEAAEHPRRGMAVVDWFARLQGAYGIRLLLLLFASQHIQKGLVQQMRNSSIMWLFRDYGVNGPRMQVLHGVASAAWALKPIIGMVSDLLPIGGYNKAPYVVLASLIGVASVVAIGLRSQATMSLGAAVLCLFGMSLQAATCDLLTEAKYSEHLTLVPRYGPDLISFIWGGITVGSIFGLTLVGVLLPAFGPRAVFLACVVPTTSVCYPALRNYFGEACLSAEAIHFKRQGFLKQYELVLLCVLMTALTLALTAIGTMPISHRLHCIAAVAALFIVVPCFHLVMRPEIACVNSFFVLQSASSITISGATFYFYTDGPAQYPAGPHFSVGFFTTALGLVSCVMSILGLATYNKYLKHWSYRPLLFFTNFLVTILSLLDTMMFLRWNEKIGIHDTFFIVGSSLATAVIRQWRWMPGVVIMSQLCPRGMEATMLALLAGCDNLGNQIGDYIGAYVLEVLDVHPKGGEHEGAEFDNLWKASLVATFLPVFTVLLVPVCIPNAKQTDTLLVDHVNSPTAGSPFSWLMGREAFSADDREFARLQR